MEYYFFHPLRGSILFDFDSLSILPTPMIDICLVLRHTGVHATPRAPDRTSMVHEATIIVLVESCTLFAAGSLLVM